MCVCVCGLLADRIGSTYRTVAAVSLRKVEIDETGDMSIGHVVKTRSDAFRKQYPNDVPAILSFFDNETQRDPSMRVWQHAANNHHISGNRRVCGTRQWQYHTCGNVRQSIQCECCSSTPDEVNQPPFGCCATPHAWHLHPANIGGDKCDDHGVQYQMMTNSCFLLTQI